MTWRVLDLFCGAGGASVGLKRAWPDAEIIGIDNRPQKHYPFMFVQADAMIYPLDGFDFIWASPPCQDYSVTRGRSKRRYPRLINPIRERLAKTGLPYIIENVTGAQAEMHAIIMLCGAMFGLKVYRHRWFESNAMLLQPPHEPHRDSMPRCCNGHKYPSSSPKGFITVTGHSFRVKEAQVAMGIDWMAADELNQAIPPAYSYYIAKQIRRYE